MILEHFIFGAVNSLEDFIFCLFVLPCADFQHSPIGSIRLFHRACTGPAIDDVFRPGKYVCEPNRETRRRNSRPKIRHFKTLSGVGGIFFEKLSTDVPKFQLSLRRIIISKSPRVLSKPSAGCHRYHKVPRIFSARRKKNRSHGNRALCNVPSLYCTCI